MNEEFMRLALQLKEASEQGDFEAVTELDLLVRIELQKLLELVTTEQDKKVAISILKRYQKIYDLLLKDSRKHRDDISMELKKISKESKAINSYLDSASYK